MKFINVEFKEDKLPSVIKLYDNSYRPVILERHKINAVIEYPTEGVIGEYKVTRSPTFMGKHLTCTITETKTCYANALRRMLITEYPTYALHIIRDTFQNTDRQLNIDKIQDNICSIPIRGYTNEKISINLHNTDIGNAGIVLTDHIMVGKSNLVKLGMCNSMEIFTLFPNHKISMDLELQLLSGSDVGQHSSCYKVILTPTTRSNVYNENVEFNLTCSTNGHVDPHKLIIESCKKLIDRYNVLLSNLHSSMTNTGDNGYIFEFLNESHTIIDPISKELSYGQFKDIISHSSTHVGTERCIKLSINLVDNTHDIIHIMKETIKTCIANVTLSNESIKALTP